MTSFLARLISILPATAFNLIPLYGIVRLGWDPAAILMLYWAETAILFFWTMVRIRFVPVPLLGVLIVNGVKRPGTHLSMIGFFSLHAGVFLIGHLVFLTIMFARDWLSRPVTGDEALGLLAALVFAFVAGGISALTGPYRPAAIDRAARAIGLTPPPPPPPPETGEAVGPIVGGLYKRIVIMQVAIIGGAWLGARWGSTGPLVIVIGLKTLIDVLLRLRR